MLRTKDLLGRLDWPTALISTNGLNYIVTCVHQPAHNHFAFHRVYKGMTRLDPNFFFILVLLFLSAGCDDEHVQKLVILDQEFTLVFQEEGQLKDGAFKISFQEILEDSRCPSDVQCVWAGQAKVLLHFTEKNKPTDNVELILGVDNPELATKVIGAYTIRLLEVDPYPLSTREVAPSDYSIRLIILKD